MIDVLYDALRSGFSLLAVWIPQFLIFLLILLIGYLIARAIAKAVDVVLERVGFDRLVERGGVKRVLARSKYDASSIIGRIVYYAIMLFVLQLAFGVFGPNPISDLLTNVIGFLPGLIVAIIIVIVAAAIAAAVRELIVTTLGGLSYGRLLGNLASAFIIGLGIIAALNQVGVATAITTPILITVLATIGGVIVVGAGGGLIRPMQGRWERWLVSLERESANVRQQVRTAPPADQQLAAAADRARSQAAPAPATTETQVLPGQGATRSYTDPATGV